MHVEAERCRCRAPRQATLLLANFGERQSEPAEFLWHRREQIIGLAQFLEIFKKEPVLAVVDRGAPRATLQEIFGQDQVVRHNVSSVRDGTAYPVLSYRAAPAESSGQRQAG